MLLVFAVNRENESTESLVSYISGIVQLSA